MLYNGILKILASDLLELFERVYLDAEVGGLGAHLVGDFLDDDDVLEARFRVH